MSKIENEDSGSPFGALSKLIEQFKLPGVDMGSIVANRQKDIQALIDTNNAAHESFRQLAKKQADIYTQAMQSAQEGLQAMAKNGMAVDPSKLNEFVLKAHEKAVAQMKELAQMTQQAQNDAMARITQRAHESMEELKKLLHPK